VPRRPPPLSLVLVADLYLVLKNESRIDPIQQQLAPPELLLYTTVYGFTTRPTLYFLRGCFHVVCRAYSLLLLGICVRGHL
jgi:hypothetical protein